MDTMHALSNGTSARLTKNRINRFAKFKCECRKPFQTVIPTNENELSEMTKLVYKNFVQKTHYGVLRVCLHGLRLPVVVCVLNPIQGRLFWSSGGRGGGGGHKVPPSKNPVPLLRIYSSKIFLKACPKLSLVKKLGFHGNHGYGFKVVDSFQFFD